MPYKIGEKETIMKYEKIMSDYMISEEEKNEGIKKFIKEVKASRHEFDPCYGTKIIVKWNGFDNKMEFGRVTSLKMNEIDRILTIVFKTYYVDKEHNINSRNVKVKIPIEFITSLEAEIF